MNIFRKGPLYLAALAAVAVILTACGAQAAETPTPVPTEAVIESKAVDDVVQTPADESEAKDAVTNAVIVEDQLLGSNDTVTIAAVTAEVDGWLVIHAQADGKPGPILGKASIMAGQNDEVVVDIDKTAATQTLYAMLHVDAGIAGEFDFPGGEDVPATDGDGNVVTPPFTITFSNSVSVIDQDLGEEGTVAIAEVISAEPGWLVVHGDADGSPGPILGAAPVQTGINNDVIVSIDLAGATETLYAMLHADRGAIGEFEFPSGEDVPATDAGGNVVTPPFTVTGGLSSAASLLTAESPVLGTYLTDSAGMTLYTFALDVPGTSNCYDNCAAAWPPLVVAEGEKLLATEGIPGEIATTDRDDGTFQVTYDGWPLYYWINDAVPGDTSGHNVNNVWAVAYPNTHLFLGGNDELGRFLVGPEGMTLYRFNPDEPGTSTCYEQCAANWPPLLIEEGQKPNGNAGVVGDLGTIARDDGTTQVTYQGMPLYYWINDTSPGDATGQGINDIWFVVDPYTVRLGKTEELGDFLVSANGMTLYMFTVDEENTSNCYEQCAANWPPLLLQEGEVPVPGAGVTGSLGVTERDGGTFQVTYNGMPLYFWANDKAPGDTTGQGVNDVWFVVEP